jgi:hypothetical protein
MLSYVFFRTRVVQNTPVIPFFYQIPGPMGTAEKAVIAARWSALLLYSR